MLNKMIQRNAAVSVMSVFLLTTFFTAGTAFSATATKKQGPTKEQIYKIAGDFSSLSYDGTDSEIFYTLKSAGWQPQCDSFQKTLTEIKSEIQKMSPAGYAAANNRKATSKDVESAVSSFTQSIQESNLYASSNVNPAVEDKIYTESINEAYNNFSADNNRIEQHFGYAVGMNVINDKKVYVIAFRGTADDYSWIFTDFIAFPTEFLKTGTHVHIGFEWNRQACMEQDLLKAFIELIKADKSNPMIIITGHSMGAAVAVLDTAYFIENKIFDPKNIHLVTLAEPCPGKEDFTERYKKQIKNYKWICNLFDPVPVAPMIVGYKHFDYLFGLLMFNSKTPPVPPIKDAFGRHDLTHYTEYIDSLQPKKNI